MKNCNEQQTQLFAENELNQLQEIIKTNYEKVVQENLFIPEAEEDDVIFETVETDCISLGNIQDSLIPVDEIEQIISDGIAAQEKLHDLANKEAHKNCELHYFEKPKDDNERLLNLQYRYLKNDDLEAWGMLLEFAYEVTKRILWNWLKSHKDVYLDKIAQDEKTSEAMYYVLRRYKTNIGWYVKANYIGALKGGVLHAMRYTTKMEQNTIVTDDVNKFRSKNAKCKNTT